MKLVLLFLALLSGSIDKISSFTITDIRTDRGGEIERPASTDAGAPDIHLECNLDFNAREKWTTCKWTKLFPEVPVDWTQRSTSSLPYAFIMCTATHLSDHNQLYNQVCEDQGNLNNERYGDPALNPYTQYDTARLRYSVRDTACGLTITRPHANDTGTWKCSVTDNSPEGTPVTLFKEVRLYTAVQSSINITQPDLVANPSYSLSLDLTDKFQDELETLECTASGAPPADIVWYIDDPNNRIDEGVSQRIVSNGDFDVKVVSTLSRLTLDRNRLSQYGVQTTNSYFAFAVGCYADQGNYFPDSRPSSVSEWSNPAEVMVYGTSSAGAAAASLLTLLLALLAPALW